MNYFYKCTLFVMMIPATCLAERYDITADIGQVRYHEGSTTLAPQWKKSLWFGLKLPDKTPNCQLYNGEYSISIPSGNEGAI